MVFFLMLGRPPRSTQSRSSAASDVYKETDRRKQARGRSGFRGRRQSHAENTRCTVSAFTHTYYGPYLQDISASSRHGGHLVRLPPHLVHRRKQARGRSGFRGRRQSHAVHGNCFYTRVLWAILTGYVGWFAARPPRTAAAARSRRTCSVRSWNTAPGRCGVAGRRQKPAVHGKCFYTRVLWAIVTGYVGWFAVRRPRSLFCRRTGPSVAAPRRCFEVHC